MQHQKIKHTFFIRLVAGLLFLGLPGISKAFDPQIKADFEKVPAFDTYEKIKKSEKTSADTLINKIQGGVVDSQTKKFVPAATVVIKGTVVVTSTDAEGNFNLVIPEKLLNRKIVLVISTVGYVGKEFLINRKDLKVKKTFMITKWHKQ